MTINENELVFKTCGPFNSDVNAHQPMGWQGIPIPVDTRLYAVYTAKMLGHKLLLFDESLVQLKQQLETRTI